MFLLDPLGRNGRKRHIHRNLAWWHGGVVLLALIGTLLLLPTLVQATSWGADCLSGHNSARAAAGLPPLSWDLRLASDAQSWANTLASRMIFQHSKMSHGENLYEERGLSPFPSCLKALKAWTDEQPLYHDEIIPQGDFEAYGHYTQVMWGPTTKIGCGMSTKRDGTFVTVCEYSPPGNVVGKRLSAVNAPYRGAKRSSSAPAFSIKLASTSSIQQRPSNSVSNYQQRYYQRQPTTQPQRYQLYRDPKTGRYYYHYSSSSQPSNQQNGSTRRYYYYTTPSRTYRSSNSQQQSPASSWRQLQ